MNYLEPFQHLKFYLNTKGDNCVYIQSAINVLLEDKISLVAKEPVVPVDNKATIDYFQVVNESVTDPGIFEYTKLIRITEKLSIPKGTSVTSAATMVRNAATAALGRGFVFTVVCNVHKSDGTTGGQATNTINKDGDVIII